LVTFGESQVRLSRGLTTAASVHVVHRVRGVVAVAATNACFFQVKI
jgi:hypothetical protein